MSSLSGTMSHVRRHFRTDCEARMFYMTVFGLGLAIVGIFSGQLLDGTSLMALLQPAAFLIVFGGTLGAVVAQSSPKDFLMGAKLLQWLFHPPVSDREETIREIVGWSKITYRSGTLKLDSLSEAIQDPLLKNGVEMIVDHF